MGIPNATQAENAAHGAYGRIRANGRLTGEHAFRTCYDFARSCYAELEKSGDSAGVPHDSTVFGSPTSPRTGVSSPTPAIQRLFVLSCALRPYEIAFDSLPPLKHLAVAERANFVVDEDGSYIHWPVPDIPLDLDSIRAVIDPGAPARTEAAKALHDSRYGAAIAKLRLRMGLKQFADQRTL